ncbi:MAG: PspA/IM30 family protein [Polyangiaceae bacterium]|nr:PspA/IM30 family protein [Polyangiaceae bacterium]
MRKPVKPFLDRLRSAAGQAVQTAETLLTDTRLLAREKYRDLGISSRVESSREAARKAGRALADIAEYASDRVRKGGAPPEVHFHRALDRMVADGQETLVTLKWDVALSLADARNLENLVTKESANIEAWEKHAEQAEKDGDPLLASEARSRAEEYRKFVETVAEEARSADIQVSLLKAELRRFNSALQAATVTVNRIKAKDNLRRAALGADMLHKVRLMTEALWGEEELTKPNDKAN